MFYKSFLLVAFITLFVFVPQSKAQANNSQEIPTLTYSELIKNKEIYVEKIIRVKAIHIYGFEWSFLCDANCKSRKPETWVEFIDKDDLCKGSKGKLKGGSDNFDNKAEVIYVGKLSSGIFGDGSYSFQFMVNCVEKFKKLKVK